MPGGSIQICSVIEMAFYKITYNPHFKRANLYGWSCNFRCRGCSYKLKSPYEGEPFLSLEKVKEVLRGLDIEKVHFLGGEPTTNPDLPEIARFAHNELGAYTKIGHSNGSNMPPQDIDATSVSIKAYTDALHIDYTGVSNATALKNFAEAYRLGIKLDASSVFIPGYIACDEIERIARFIAGVDPNIPYHIVGYVPVPGVAWRRPTYGEMEEAAAIASKYLASVTFSHLNLEDFVDLGTRDIRYRSVVVAGSGQKRF